MELTKPTCWMYVVWVLYEDYDDDSHHLTLQVQLQTTGTWKITLRTTCRWGKSPGIGMILFWFSLTERGCLGIEWASEHVGRGWACVYLAVLFDLLWHGFQILCDLIGPRLSNLLFLNRSGRFHYSCFASYVPQRVPNCLQKIENTPNNIKSIPTMVKRHQQRQ